LCQNVGTVKAIHDAVIDNKPLISRVVTVTGSAVNEPRNYEARLGTSFASVVEQSKPDGNKHHIRMGGMMMGVDIPNSEYSICKITNCIFVNDYEPRPEAKECIRCSSCAQVCPVNLLPQQLYWYAKSENIEKANDYNLGDCIECGCCAYVCPSNIPLSEYFIFAKALSRKLEREDERTNAARKRFEFKEYRVERNKRERAEMMAAKKKALKAKMAKDKEKNGENKDKIAAAMDRVNKAKKDKKDADA